jgi:hypothetical protein
MEKLIILRMFFCFPLFGLILPDAGVLLSNNAVRVPVSHMIIELVLIVCISFCTAAIFYNKKRNQSAADSTNEASFS